MTNRERENATLSFIKPEKRGSVEETFFPWTLTVEKFVQEGLPTQVADNITDIVNDNNSKKPNEVEKYFNVTWGEGVYKYEKYLGFDPVRRIGFTLPFRCFEEEIIEDNQEFTIKSDIHGRQYKHHKKSCLVEIHKQIVSCEDDWTKLKRYGDLELDKYYIGENMENAYGQLREDHQRGDYSIRLNLEGFFWTPRELLGIEPHMYAFYDNPDLIHDMNEYILKVYIEKLIKVLDIVHADIVYIMEDLSGKNGPMISPELFDDFIGCYYRRLIPVLKNSGVRHVFVDTDGDFKKLIPNFIKAGVDGFLPMDVNAGMDIVAVRNEFPDLKFIGGYNKLCIVDGKESIDKEFERIIPVIRQGGYIPGVDHQVPPSASLENYLYYIKRLKEVMLMAGDELD
jgi:hypothetical protein